MKYTKKEVVVNQMAKVANFPHPKISREFGFKFNEKIIKSQIQNLSSLQFLNENRNIIFLGNSSLRKTHKFI